MKTIVETGRDIAAIIEAMTDKEKLQALALLQGMQIGKELATADKSA